MDESLLNSIEGMMAVILVLIAVILLKRIQARTRQKIGAPDIVIKPGDEPKD